MNYRIKKKLKKFYYIPDLKKTRQRVYSRFKKSVLYKFRRRKARKLKSIYTGRKFNLITYNARGSYRYKMKMLKLKKKSTPKFFFFNGRKNNYIRLRFNKLHTKLNKLSEFLLKIYKLNIKKKGKFIEKNFYNLIKRFGFLKKKHVMKYIRD
jgi:hypothetical protein